MKKYAFIGGYDKTELLLFLAKISTLVGNKVLIIDATIPQKARYVVPVMKPAQKYITTFENIDVAIGFRNFEEILEYTAEGKLQYNMVLLDIDSQSSYFGFNINPQDEHCFVTGFDLYSLRKGIGVLRGIKETTQITKIYFSKDMLQEEDEYLSMMCQKLKIDWHKETVYFPFERGDQNVINTNQRFGKIKIKGLSKDYINALKFVAEQNLGLNDGEIRRAIKIMERV